MKPTNDKLKKHEPINKMNEKSEAKFVNEKIVKRDAEHTKKMNGRRACFLHRRKLRRGSSHNSERINLPN